MVVIAVKKRSKTGREHPRDPNTFYLYEVRREGNKVKSKYLGKGRKNSPTVVQNIKCEDDDLPLHKCSECQHLQPGKPYAFCPIIGSFLDAAVLNQPYPCDGFELKRGASK